MFSIYTQLEKKDLFNKCLLSVSEEPGLFLECGTLFVTLPTQH